VNSPGLANVPELQNHFLKLYIVLQLGHGTIRVQVWLHVHSWNLLKDCKNIAHTLLDDENRGCLSKLFQGQNYLLSYERYRSDVLVASSD
jgi:hypothetical protein